MPNITFNGLSQRDPANCDDEYEFGILPDDDDMGNIPTGEEIDAVNDETFGEDINFQDADDLEEFAKQTEVLSLKDPASSGWMDIPTCSVSAPHPSQIPIPSFSDVANQNTYTDKVQRMSVSYQKSSQMTTPHKFNLGTVETLWNYGRGDENIWEQGDPKSSINCSDFSSVHKRNGKEIGDIYYSSGRLVKNGLPPQFPVGISKGDQIERVYVPAPSCSSAPNVPPIPSSAMTLADIENRLLMESTNTKITSNATYVSGPEELRLNTVAAPHSQFPPQTTRPPFPLLPPHFIPPHLLQAARVRMAGQLPDISPDLSTMPPHIRSACLASLASNMTGGPHPFGMIAPQLRMPFVGSMPPLQPFPPNLILCNGRPHQPNYRHSLWQSNASSKDTYNTTHSRRSCLPSGKTLSDFAFEPYAGFMSKKEREWLIKIQTLQCMGTGDPYEDDFYYTSWRRNQLSPEQPVKAVKLEKRDSESPVHCVPQHYVPPSFVGSLGKPSLSTTSNPRQLIDLTSDTTDDDDRFSTRTTSQKKLRALLMQLENAAFLILECDDRRRELQTVTVSEDVHAQMTNEIKSRLEFFRSSICSADRLSAVLHINKGRELYCRALLHATRSMQRALIDDLFAVLCVVTRRLPGVKLESPLLTTLNDVFSQWSKEHILDIARSFPIEALSKNNCLNNTFVVNVILCLLVNCARKRCSLRTEFINTTMYSWMKSKKCPCPLSEQCSPKSGCVYMLPFSSDDFETLRSWLQDASFPLGSAGSCLLSTVSEKIPK